MGIRGRLLTIVPAAVLPLPLCALFFARENRFAFVLAGLIAGLCAAEDAEFLEDADVSGVGPGLYLGKNVIERMGGRITVETEVGRGSVFTLHLPVWKAGNCGNSSKEKGNGEKIAGR